MRLRARDITRAAIISSADTFELVEAYPDDKYLPSYLVLAYSGARALHILFATDVEDENVRVVTVYSL